MKNISLELPQSEIDLEKRLRETEGRLAKRIYDLEKWRAQKEGRSVPPQPSLPPALPPLNKAPGAVLARQQALSRAMDEVYFTAELHNGVVHYTGSGASAMNGFAPVMRFPNGAVSSCSINRAARELWPRTVPRITVWYSSPVGSTATFNFRFNSVFFGAGSTTSGPVFGVDWTAAGPAVANDVLVTSAIQAGAFYSSPFGVVRFQLFRNAQGEDANVNNLDILLALVTLEEQA